MKQNYIMTRHRHEGCQTCRLRKVKCDESPDRCKNCQRASLACAYDKGEQHTTEAGPKRLRTFRSCRPCRAVKGRCSGDKPQCQRCRLKRLDCSYEDHCVPAWKRSYDCNPNRCGNSSTSGICHSTFDSQSGQDQTRKTSHDQARPEHQFSWLLGSALPKKTKMLLLFNEYFQHIHSLRCFNFIHRASFWEELETRSAETLADNPLLLIVCAMGARLHAVKKVQEEG